MRRPRHPFQSTKRDRCWRRRAIVSLLALPVALGGTGYASAEPALPSGDAVPKVTLSAALAQARQHQPRLRAALAELAVRESEARIPGAAWLPRLGSTAQIFVGTANNSTGGYVNVRETDLPRIGGTRAGQVGLAPAPSTIAAVTLRQEVYDFGRIAAETALGDALTEVARAEVAATRLGVALAVEETFHGVLAAHEIESATAEAYRRAEVHRDYARAAVRSGMRPPIELTRAEADLAQLEVRRLQAESGLVAARAALAATIGSEALEVDAEPPGPGSPETEWAPAFSEAIRLALAREPALQAALGRLQAAEAARRELGRELLPNLFASGTLSGRAGGAAPTSGEVPYGSGWLPGVLNWDVGLVLSWDLLDAPLLARRAAAVAREEAARAELAVVRTDVRLGAERAYVDLVAALRALPGLAAAVDAARANQAQSDARFRAGLGTSIEVADAEALLTSADLQLAIGRFAVARARARLGRALAELPAPAFGEGR